MVYAERSKTQLRIGVDCGGTNTDAVIVDLSPGVSANDIVLASYKTPTTPEVTHGIQDSIRTVLVHASHIEREHIQSVSIGTTHFVNALVTRAADRLDKVAVIRLCGPFSRRTKPFIGFPMALRGVMEGAHYFVDGGLQIDGRVIRDVDEEQIKKVCEDIKGKGIRAIAITAIFAPIDFDLHQEEQVEQIVRQCIPGAFTSISKKVANHGLVARENATILNASLLRFAAITVHGFKTAIKALDLKCPVFVTSNDGCLMTLEQAAELPIRTFSSGPTNSMRGAAFLSNLVEGSSTNQTALVMDIGGTTTEVGVLLPSGFPRQSAAQYELCGVRLNFSMPYVSSIGLGGGSLVSRDAQSGKAVVGPSSVGYKLVTEARVFGGQVLTTTDICVAAGLVSDIGDASLVKDMESSLIDDARERWKAMLEQTIDSMKTSTEDVPLYLTGGGAILCPEALNGVSKVHRFPHYQCANAVGAAIAQISGQVDTVKETGSLSLLDMRKKLDLEAIEMAVRGGALRESVNLIESEAIPVGYVAGRSRFVIRAAGEWDGKASSTLACEHILDPRVELSMNGHSTLNGSHYKPNGLPNGNDSSEVYDKIWTAAEIMAYRPKVRNKRWNLSELDAKFITIGNYILGTGGGGDPETARLALLDGFRNGYSTTVIDLTSVASDKLIGWGGMMGSPDASSERLLGEEYADATRELWKFLGIDRTHVGGLLANEIGGSNGMISMVFGSSGALDIPIIDGDFMGRAYPTGWQTTCNVYDLSDRAEMLLPSCGASGDGSTMFLTSVRQYKECDSLLRAACVECGSRLGNAHRPLPMDYALKSVIRRTVSLSWRIGRAVTLAQKQANISNVGQIVIDAVGGSDVGKVLFEGKIVGVERRTMRGHSHGEVTIEALASNEEDDSMKNKPKYEGRIGIPFKNENLIVKHTSTKGVERILCTVPDLICVLDAGSGCALGTQEYKYGLRVIVIALTGAPQWTSTKRGLEIGGPHGFGYDLEYTPIGKHVEPRSVIEEYNVE